MAGGPTGDAAVPRAASDGPAVLSRPRLTALVGGAPVVLAVADGGYGKSVLLREIAVAQPVAAVLCELDRPTGVEELLAGLVRAARGDGLSDLAALLGADPADPVGTLARALRAHEPVTVVIDEIGRLDDEAAQVVAAAAGAVTAPGRLLLAGRTAPAALLDLTGTVVLGADELAFRPDEIAALLGRDERAAEVATVADLTGGWPAAVAVAASRAHRPPAVRGEVLPSRDAVPPAVRALACLPLLDARVVAAVTDAPDPFAAAGVPLTVRPDGWWELADPLRDRLSDPSALPAAVRRRVATLYAETGQLATALASLSGHGIGAGPADAEGVAALLAAVHWTALEQIGLPDVRAAVDALPDAVLAAHPQALVSAVRMTENLPVGDERGRWIERGLRILPAGAPGRTLLVAEQARMAVRVGDLATAADRAGAALAAAGDDPLVRGRARFVLGMAHAYRGDPDGLRAATDDLTEAAAELRRAGDRRWEAEAQLMLGFGLDYPSGALDSAVERVRAGIGLLAAAEPVRATLLTYLAEILVWAADPEGARVALEEAHAISRRSSDARLTAYVHWSWAWLDCSRGDAVGCREHLAAVQRHFGPWSDLPSGLAFLGEAAEMLASLGDEAGARAALTAARQRPDAAELDHLLSRGSAVVAAHFDDPVAAGAALQEQAASPDTRPIDRPRLLLLTAWCAHRAGDEPAAVAAVAAARSAASALGLTEAQWVREREIADWAAALTGAPARTAVLEVRVLDGFAVLRDGDDVTPPPGHPSALVALLAVRGPTAAETVVDLLWPDVDLSTGRSRLRNLLNRIRSASGELVDRHGVELRLADGVGCDLHAFDDAAGRALSAVGDDRAGPARQALVRAGELLPAEPGGWAVPVRRRVHRTTLELLDVVAESAWRTGDLDDAARQLRRAVELEPHDEVRYVRLAQLLVRQGRRGSAREVVRRALAAAAELGAPPGPEIARLVTVLGRRRTEPPPAG